MKLAGAYIQDDTYERLAALAAANNRTLAGQCRHLFDRALRGELEVPPCEAPAYPATDKAQPQARRTRSAGPCAGGAAAACAPVQVAGSSSPSGVVGSATGLPARDAAAAAQTPRAAGLNDEARPAGGLCSCSSPCTGRCVQGAAGGCTAPCGVVTAYAGLS